MRWIFTYNSDIQAHLKKFKAKPKTKPQPWLHIAIKTMSKRNPYCGYVIYVWDTREIIEFYEGKENQFLTEQFTNIPGLRRAIDNREPLSDSKISKQYEFAIESEIAFEAFKDKLKKAAGYAAAAYIGGRLARGKQTKEQPKKQDAASRKRRAARRERILGPSGKLDRQVPDRETASGDRTKAIDRTLKTEDLVASQQQYEFQNRRLKFEQYVTKGKTNRDFNPDEDMFIVPKVPIINFFNTKYTVLHYGPAIQAIVKRKYREFEHVWIYGQYAISFTWDTREVTDVHQIDLDTYKTLLFDTPTKLKDTYKPINYKGFDIWVKFCNATNKLLPEYQKLLQSIQNAKPSDKQKLQEKLENVQDDYDSKFRSLKMFK